MSELRPMLEFARPRRRWRQLLSATLLMAVTAGAAAAPAAVPVAAASDCTAQDWPLWTSWAARHVQDDGRMLDSSLQPNHSTSEGQAYGMLFALIANDATRFERLWTWTASNMMGADPAKRLPGWLWGQGKDGKWQLQDGNSAADADLWIAYALLEAARLWQRPDYRKAGLALLQTIKAKLVAELPGLGPMVLPGPQGFVQPGNLWTLNPSYLPLPVLRRLAKEEPAGPWKQVADNTVRMLGEGNVRGYVADWLGYVSYRAVNQQVGKFVIDPGRGEVGSYDAIRVYLWAGMTPRKDPAFTPVLNALDGMRQALPVDGVPPEKIKVVSGTLEGRAPFGYAAALVPYLVAKGDTRMAELLQRRAQDSLAALQASGQAGIRPEILYYNMMLSLFGLGWAEQRYQFRDDGTLKLSWERSCARAVQR